MDSPMQPCPPTWQEAFVPVAHAVGVALLPEGVPCLTGLTGPDAGWHLAEPGVVLGSGVCRRRAAHHGPERRREQQITSTEKEEAKAEKWYVGSEAPARWVGSSHLLTS